MATSAESMRLKVSFEGLLNIMPSLPRKIWMLVNLENIKSILDLQHLILSRFNVQFPVQLHLDGCLLPSWESVKVIRENEEICIFQDGPVSCKNKTESETGVVMVKQTQANVRSGVSEENSQEKALKNLRKKAKRKHSQHEDDFIADDVLPGSDPNTLEGNAKEEGQMNPVSLEMIEDTGRVTYVVLENENNEGTSEQPSPRKTDLEIDNKELECSAMDLAIRKTLESAMPSPAEIDVSHSGSKDDTTKISGQKRKRKRTRKRKNKSNTSQTDGFQDSSALCASTPTTCEKPVEYKESYFGAKHMKFGDSDEEETTPEQSVPERSTLASSAITTNSQTNTTAESGYNSTQKDISASHNESNHKDTLPQCVNGKENGSSKPEAASQMIQPKLGDTKTVGSSVECVTTFQKGPFANAKVFRRKQNKKAGSVPLTKEEQLSSVASSTPCIFQKNSSDSSAKNCSTSHVEPVSLRKADESTEPCTKDFSVYPDLIGPPRPGDVIAFKMLEMSENYCPELSDYKEARVLSYDINSREIELELLTLNQVKRKGRFDIVIEDEDCIMTNTEKLEAKMIVPLASLNQPKLIT